MEGHAVAIGQLLQSAQAQIRPLSALDPLVVFVRELRLLSVGLLRQTGLVP